MDLEIAFTTTLSETYGFDRCLSQESASHYFNTELQLKKMKSGL